MPTIAITMKLHLRPSEEDVLAFGVMSKAYMEACNFVAQYAFDNGCFLSVLKLHKALYQTVRSQFGAEGSAGCIRISGPSLPATRLCGSSFGAPVPLQR